MKYKKWVKIEQDTSMGITQFRFLNQLGEDIDISQKDEIFLKDKDKE